MFAIRRERARLEELRASLHRLMDEKGDLSSGCTAKALLMCKEEDTRREIADVLFCIEKYDKRQNKTCETCDGTGFVSVPRGNHSAGQEHPCLDCGE